MKNYLLLALAAVALCFTACKKDNPVTGISLDKTMVALEIGDSDTLTATVAPDDATNKDVDWSVADDAIATVEDGVVTAVAAGQTTVTVTTVDGGFTASATITVAESIIKVTGISLDKTMVALEIGDSDTLTATVAPDNAKNKGVEWSVADDAIATVEDGVVKAVAIGETTVTVTTVDGGFTASATITVVESIIKVTGVTLDKPGLELEIGDSDILTATVAPDDATNKGVEWSVADDAIATVEDGVVTAVAAGQTTVTVTTVDGGFKATANVVVKAAPIKVTGVSLDKTMVTLEIDESVTVEATVTPENATNKEVKWSIANTAIATVTDGVVTAVAEGETELTVTTADGGHTATIPVKVVAQSVKVTAIKLVGVPTEAKEGRITTISAVITPTDATDMTVTFTSSNPDVVKVEFTKSESNYSLALLTAVGGGKAKITATANDGSGVKAEAEVTVIPAIKVTEIKIGPENATIKVDETMQFAVAISPSDADNKEVEWSSSDTSVATVKATNANFVAEVTGVGKGTATITATAKDGSGVKGETTITVVGGEKPTSITVDGKNNVKRLTWHGKKIEIVPDMIPVSADLSTLTWTVSDWITQNPSTCNISAKKITVESNLSHYPYQFESVLNGTTIYGNDGNDRFDFTVYFRTHAIFSKHFEETKQRIDLSLPTTSIQISADLVELPYNVNAGTLYFEAYCPPIEYYASASPMWKQFPEAYIPTSEYTLTSSDETKWKVTKVSESTYKIEDLDPSNYKEIDLTYTCGEFSFTRKFKVVPR